MPGAGRVRATGERAARPLRATAEHAARSGSAPGPPVATRSQPAVANGLGHPRDDLIEHGVQRGGGLEPEHLAGLGDIRYPLGYVVRERLVADVAERYVRALDLAPDQLRQL